MAELEAFDRETRAVVAFVLAMEEIIDIVAPCDEEEGWEPALAAEYPRLRQAA
jgi:hypothetical protein